MRGLKPNFWDVFVFFFFHCLEVLSSCKSPGFGTKDIWCCCHLLPLPIFFFSRLDWLTGEMKEKETKGKKRCWFPRLLIFFLFFFSQSFIFLKCRLRAANMQTSPNYSGNPMVWAIYFHGIFFFPFFSPGGWLIGVCLSKSRRARPHTEARVSFPCP